MLNCVTKWGSQSIRLASIVITKFVDVLEKVIGGLRKTVLTFVNVMVQDTDGTV